MSLMTKHTTPFAKIHSPPRPLYILRRTMENLEINLIRARIMGGLLRKAGVLIIMFPLVPLILQEIKVLRVIFKHFWSSKRVVRPTSAVQQLPRTSPCRLQIFFAVPDCCRRSSTTPDEFISR